MKQSRKSDYIPQIDPQKAPPCCISGCAEPGGYKAPVSRSNLNEYQWFCLEHVREHNAKWDYLAGLEQEEIEDFMKDAVTGHRPTWQREGHAANRYAKLQEALYHFMHLGPGPTRSYASTKLSRKMRKALQLLELNYPYTQQDLKRQYRIMVKRYHPDVNKGTKVEEERFKQITVSYSMLEEHLSTGNLS